MTWMTCVCGVIMLSDTQLSNDISVYVVVGGGGGGIYQPQTSRCFQ